MSESLSTLEYHLLLTIVEGPRHGYAIRDAVEEESSGTLTPRAGTLYRVIARLISWGLITEADPPEDAAPHPGRERRYYGLTAQGRAALAGEAERLRSAAKLAQDRLGLS